MTNLPANACLTDGEGIMPIELKRALVHPLVNKPSLYKDTISNYRPVSHLSHLSDVIEKVAATSLNAQFVSQSLTHPFQSAYKRSHSTDTALLLVVNEIWTALDCRQGSIVVLIDISAAFGNIYHSILLDYLMYAVEMSLN